MKVKVDALYKLETILLFNDSDSLLVNGVEPSINLFASAFQSPIITPSHRILSGAYSSDQSD